VSALRHFWQASFVTGVELFADGGMVQVSGA
jgi:hypothetical protein